MQVYNSSMSAVVVREGGRLDVTAILISTEEEATARISCGVKDLVIEGGDFEVFRAPGSVGVFGELLALAGKQAYLGNGAAIREALWASVPASVPASVAAVVQELVFECVRAVVQAETFLISERGFADPAAYDRFWEESYAGSCLFYEKPTHKDTWMGYVGEHKRRRNLSNRTQHVTVCQSETGYRVTASFIESFHEITICLETDLNGIVTEASAAFVRAPGEVCKQTAQLVSGLPGVALKETNKKELAAIVGGSTGCTHLTDIIARAAVVLKKCL